MDIKSIVLLIGLAVTASGCFTDTDRSKRQLKVHNPHNHGQSGHQIPQLMPDLHDPHRNSKNNHFTPDPADTQRTVSPSLNNNVNNDVSRDIALNVLALSQELIQRKLASPSASKYEVLSPISITSALQLAFLGARGSTYEELKTLLKYSSDAYALSEIHRQFGEIIKDLQSNEMNPQREVAYWRQKARDGYVEKYMKTQSAEPNSEEHKIEMANGIFVHQDTSLRPLYQDVVSNVYQSSIMRLDFRTKPESSSRYINDWVNQKTHGKIKEIVPRVMDPNTKAVLANALYFNAQWQTSFIRGATMMKKFHPYGRDNDTTIFVNLMAHGGKFPHHYDSESNSDILGFPYKQNSTTMYVILPRDSSIEKLKRVQGQLTAEKIDAIIDQMTLKTSVILFPKMHLESSHYLKPELQQMGARSLFNPSRSDLSLLTDQPDAIEYKERISFPPTESNRWRGKRSAVSYKTPSENNERQQPLDFKDFLVNKRIVKSDGADKKKRRSKRDTVDDLERLRAYKPAVNPGLFADEVIHKVDLNINEQGTEGGAATAITLNRSGPQVVFRVDTPFLFLIRHDPTKIPLFYGSVFEPPYEEEPRPAYHNSRN